MTSPWLCTHTPLSVSLCVSLSLRVCLSPSVYVCVCVSIYLAGMLVYSIVWTTWTRKYWLGALQRLGVVLLQLHPFVHVYESLQVGIETTGCE